MNISIYLVFALLLIVCALLLLVVLMQRPKQEGLGAAFGSQMTDQAFGARTTDVLKKGTVLFGTLFLILCLTLGILINRRYAAEKSDLGKQQPAAARANAAQGARNAAPEDLSQKLAPVAPAIPAADEAASAPQKPAPAAEPAADAPAPAPATETAAPAPAPEQPAAPDVQPAS